jgi:hypothetical protein
MLSKNERIGYVVASLLSIGVLLFDLLFNQLPQFFPISILPLVWVVSWLIWRILSNKIQNPRLKNNRFFGLVIIALGHVVVATHWAIRQERYEFNGTGYLYFLYPIVAFLFWCMVGDWFLKNTKKTS